MKFCIQCGNPIEADVKFCTKCGKKVQNLNIASDEEKIDLNKKISENVVENIDFSKESEINQETLVIKNNELDKKNQRMEEENNFNVRLQSNKRGYSEEDTNKRNNRVNDEYNYRKVEKRAFSSTLLKVIIAIVLIIIICIGVFFNRIVGEYYIFKAYNAANITEKFEYAEKAIKMVNASDTQKLLKSVLIDMAKNDAQSAEDKLNEVSSLFSQGDYQNTAIEIKNKKIDKLCNDRKYQEAAAEFSEIDKLGGNFKDNKNYDDIMLNVIGKITNTPVANTKSLLMDDKQICYENFDDDPFDEVIELKSNNKYGYNLGFKLNLYKMKNGQYKLVDSFTMDHTWNQAMQGVYKYSENKNGIFIRYSNTSNSSGTSVFGVNNEKLQLKGTVFGNNDTKPDDADGDGIYEILSNSTSVVAANKKDNTKWYKIYEDGRTPTEVNSTGGGKATSSTKASDDYIFKDSDKRYLMEDDLVKLSKDQLGLARNEIFARHGYVFTTDEYKKYFSSKSWYVPNPNYDGSDSTLNEYEIANYKVLQTWEQKK